MGAKMRKFVWTVMYKTYEGSSTNYTIRVVGTHVENAAERAKAAIWNVNRCRKPVLVLLVRGEEVYV